MRDSDKTVRYIRFEPGNAPKTIGYNTGVTGRRRRRTAAGARHLGNRPLSQRFQGMQDSVEALRVGANDQWNPDHSTCCRKLAIATFAIRPLHSDFPSNDGRD